MFVAFDAQHDWANYDFVIIGAGVAGLFLAEKFAPAGRVLVIEAGGKDPGGLGEGYYDIDSTGRPYGALGKRLSDARLMSIAKAVAPVIDTGIEERERRLFG